MKNHSFKNSLRKFVANDFISTMCYWKLHFNEHIFFKSKLIISYEKRIDFSNNQVKHKSKIVVFWEPDTRMYSGSSFGSYTFPELQLFCFQMNVKKERKDANSHKLWKSFVLLFRTPYYFSSGFTKTFH